MKRVRRWQTMPHHGPSFNVINIFETRHYVFLHAFSRHNLPHPLKSCQTMPHWGTSSEFQLGEGRFKTRHYVILLHVFLRHTFLLPFEIRYTCLTEALVCHRTCSVFQLFQRREQGYAVKISANDALAGFLKSIFSPLKYGTCASVTTFISKKCSWQCTQFHWMCGWPNFGIIDTKLM